MKEKKTTTASVANVFKLNGRVPLGKAIPFGAQHVLAMFVANIAPILIVANVAGLSEDQKAMLVQNAMFIAGIGTLVQLYPLWKIGARLPIVMGISFTFVTILSFVAATYGYATAMGAVLVGGLIEGILGIFAKYWRKIIAPIVAACVVTAIGFSLLVVGATSFGGGSGSPTFGSSQNLILGVVTLASCLLFNIFGKSYMKQLSVLLGLVVGYVLAIIMGVVDFSDLSNVSVFALPQFMPFKPVFDPGAIAAVTLIFMVSATETIGDTSAMAITGLGRDVTDSEISGSVACDGFFSAFSSLFGCMPITSFAQNVGLIAMTKVVNRFTIMTGAAVMILAGLVPIFGKLLATLPEAVLGGCTIMMFGTIVVSGIQMITRCGFNQRNTTIAALSLSIGIGFTQVPQIFSVFPQMIQQVFANNCVAIVFLVSLVLNLVLPKDMELKHGLEEEAEKAD